MSLCGIEKICANYEVNCTGCINCSNYKSYSVHTYNNMTQLKFGKCGVKETKT